MCFVVFASSQPAGYINAITQTRLSISKSLQLMYSGSWTSWTCLEHTAPKHVGNQCLDSFFHLRNPSKILLQSINVNQYFEWMYACNVEQRLHRREMQTEKYFVTTSGKTFEPQSWKKVTDSGQTPSFGKNESRETKSIRKIIPSISDTGKTCESARQDVAICDTREAPIQDSRKETPNVANEWAET